MDFMREAMQLVLQALIDLEAEQHIGAARYERSDTRTTQRSGTRARLLSTKAGDVELAIPKLRHGSFYPSLLEPRRRIDRALWAVIMEPFVHGVSTRKVDDLVAALGIDAGVSKSHVSRICAELDVAVGEFRERRLDHVEFPYLFLDATYVKAHQGAHVVSKAATSPKQPWRSSPPDAKMNPERRRANDTNCSRITTSTHVDDHTNALNLHHSTGHDHRFVRTDCRGTALGCLELVRACGPSTWRRAQSWTVQWLPGRTFPLT